MGKKNREPKRSQYDEDEIIISHPKKTKEKKKEDFEDIFSVDISKQRNADRYRNKKKNKKKQYDDFDDGWN